MKKKVLIVGITGQDGSYLAELLLKKKYLTSMIFESINLNKNITVTICLLIFKPKSLLSEFSRWRL